MAADQRLVENLNGIRSRIVAAARRSGRTADQITLVAVTKYVTPDIAGQLVTAGCKDLGESRPQELWAKAESLGSSTAESRAPNNVLSNLPIRWHMIGHIQRNKVIRTLPLVSLIHSGDSLRLIEAVDEAASNLNRSVAMLIEVNISGDATKHGFKPDEVEPALHTLAALKSVDIRGLMCMASREGDLDQARREFTSLRELRDRLKSLAPPNISLDELSMGMSDDFEVAIEEGATLVRVGSAIFEGLAE
jgi:pyridoxal phosphate enzyme (YggS family)